MSRMAFIASQVSYSKLIWQALEFDSVYSHHSSVQRSGATEKIRTQQPLDWVNRRKHTLSSNNSSYSTQIANVAKFVSYNACSWFREPQRLEFTTHTHERARPSCCTAEIKGETDNNSIATRWMIFTSVLFATRTHILCISPTECEWHFSRVFCPASVSSTKGSFVRLSRRSGRQKCTMCSMRVCERCALVHVSVS